MSCDYIHWVFHRCGQSNSCGFCLGCDTATVLHRVVDCRIALRVVGLHRSAGGEYLTRLTARLLGQTGELFSLIFLRQRVDDGLHAALYHLVQFIQREVDAMIRHSVLGEVVGTDALGPVATAHL